MLYIRLESTCEYTLSKDYIKLSFANISYLS